ncbi:MAG: glycosyltransferase [Frankiaceae bacterium]|nr:glycosyltransferase [Frankiaceae bacterium]
MPVRTRSPLPIPTDVTDQQKHWYFGPQKRWFLVLRFVTFIGLLVSLTRFGLGDPHVGVILVVVLLMTAVSIAGLYASTRRRRATLADHEQRVLAWSPLRPPTVDIFLPCAGEPVSVLDNTYRHVAALLYPGIQSVYVLDDGARDDVKALASRYGFNYLVRPDRGRMKKAGNLAYGVSKSSSEAIAILDADFAPRPEFLLELMPYLDDPRVGIVQSPQFFDTHVGGPWLQRAAGADQELFYRWFQPSLDAVGAPICVGTCAIYRRSALEAAGGFAQIAHSEDIHTGVAMMGKGFEIRYVPVILAKGLCPESMAPYVSQQYRWALGSLTLMASPEFRVLPLSWRQRLCYWSGFGYYIASAIVAFVAFMPPIYLLWARPDLIQDRDFLLLLPVVFAYPLMALLSRSRWEFGVLRTQVAQSFAHAVAIWDAWRGHIEDWVATGTAPRTAVGNRVGRLMATWLLVVQVALWLGITVDLTTDTLELNDAYPLILFAAFAAYLHAPLMVEVIRKPVGAAVAQPAGVTA